MPEDILEKIRVEILKEDASNTPWVPKNLDKTWEVQAGTAGAVTGALAGAALGLHMGLAGPWGAIAGTVPCAIVGGVMGYLAGAKGGSMIHQAASSDEAFSTRKSRNPMRQTFREQVMKSVESGERCPECGASKAAWWDTSLDSCRKCGPSS